MLLSGTPDPLKILIQNNYYFQLLILPVTTHLLPFTPVQPNPH